MQFTSQGNRITVRKFEGNRLFGRPRCRLEYNIKINLKQRACGLDSFGSCKGPMVGSYDHNNELLGSIKCWEVLE
jgi:hypothetical protein